MIIQYNMTIIKTISNNMKSRQIDPQNDSKCRYRSKKRQADKERKETVNHPAARSRNPGKK